jgi:GST-like protein
MVDLYTWTTPNGRKVSIMLEEVGLPYTVKTVNLGEKQQLEPEFTAINPNQQIPAIIDHDGAGGDVTIFESGAILFYLAEKTGRLFPTREPDRSRTMQWLMFQMARVGPMIGQANYFINTAPEKIEYAIKRYIDESLRVVGVLNVALEDSEYLAGDYSIADVATYPWIQAAWDPFKAMMGDEQDKVANVQRWLDAVGARPAVATGMAVPKVE